MGIFIYSKMDESESIEKFMSIEEKDRLEKHDEDGRKFILHNGEPFYRNIREEQRGVGSFNTSWPIISQAAGVNPDQRQELINHCNKKGVPTEVLRDGRVVFRDRQHRRNFLKANSLYDLDSFTGA